MLIAEDLLLLVTDEVTGKVRGHGGRVDYALAAALLCDLEGLGRIRLTTSRESAHRKNRVVVDDPSPAGDALLDRALESLAARDRTAPAAVRLLKKGLRRTLYARLVDAGVLGRERPPVLGLLGVHRHPTLDPRPASEAREAIVHRVLGLSDGRPGTSALIGCLAVMGAVPDVVPESHPMVTRAELRRQARAGLEACWPAKAARRAYRDDASAA